MERVYLDQWVWIDLARVAHGKRPHHAATADFLDLAGFGSASGLVAFPLAPAHYIELVPASPRQRKEVGGVMYELSRGHRMIGPNQHLLAAEIDCALKRHLGVPEVPRTIQVFGQGVGHAFGVGPIRLRVETTDGSTPSEDALAILRSIEPDALEILEQMVLQGHPEVEQSRELRAKYVEINEAFAREETAQAERLRGNDFPRERWKDLFTARDVVNLREHLQEALDRAGVSIVWLVDQGAELLTRILEDTPTAFAYHEIVRLQHGNPERPWRASDQVDVHALAVAVVYCDVVVAEKHWAHMIRRAGLDERFGTIVVDSPAEVMPLLLAA
jgi:hypothetical protein